MSSFVIPHDEATDWYYVSPTLLLEVIQRSQVRVYNGKYVSELYLPEPEDAQSCLPNSCPRVGTVKEVKICGWCWSSSDSVDQIGRDIAWEYTPSYSGTGMVDQSSDRMLVFLVSMHYTNMSAVWYECRWWKRQLSIKRYVHLDSHICKGYRLTARGYASVAVHKHSLSVRVPGSKKVSIPFDNPVGIRRCLTCLTEEYGYALVINNRDERTYSVYFDGWTLSGGIRRKFVKCTQLPVFSDKYILLIMVGDYDGFRTVLASDLESGKHEYFHLREPVVKLIAYDGVNLLYQSKQGIAVHNSYGQTRIIDNSVACDEPFECQWLPSYSTLVAHVRPYVFRRLKYVFRRLKYVFRRLNIV